MDQTAWIEELEAQIETHGTDKVVFELEQEDHPFTTVVITNVQFTDDQIVVTLETT